jgi:hypothetical protein
MVSRNTRGAALPGSNPEFATIFVAGPEATQADVAAAHSRLTYAVAAGQTAASLTENTLIDPRQLASGPVSGTAQGPNRAFVSGLPTTLVAGGGVPGWVHGMRAPAVTPPMHTVDGLPTQLHWIDPLVQMTLVRFGRTDVLLSVPLPMFSPAGRSFPIGAGSIWFAAGLLAPAAAGGFAGLRVTGGTLTADADLTFAGPSDGRSGRRYGDSHRRVGTNRCRPGFGRARRG